MTKSKKLFCDTHAHKVKLPYKPTSFTTKQLKAVLEKLENEDARKSKE